MSKIYLQEKIKPVPGLYLVIGEDGFLTTGRISSEVNPQIVISISEGFDVSNFSAKCNGVFKNIIFEKLSDTRFNCYLPEFGEWDIFVSRNNSVLAKETVDVTTVTTYQINFAISSGS